MLSSPGVSYRVVISDEEIQEELQKTVESRSLHGAAQVPLKQNEKEIVSTV